MGSIIARRNAKYYAELRKLETETPRDEADAFTAWTEALTAINDYFTQTQPATRLVFEDWVAFLQRNRDAAGLGSEYGAHVYAMVWRALCFQDLQSIVRGRNKPYHFLRLLDEHYYVRRLPYRYSEEFSYTSNFFRNYWKRVYFLGRRYLRELHAENEALHLAFKLKFSQPQPVWLAPKISAQWPPPRPSVDWEHPDVPIASLMRSDLNLRPGESLPIVRYPRTTTPYSRSSLFGVPADDARPLGIKLGTGGLFADGTHEPVAVDRVLANARTVTMPPTVDAITHRGFHAYDPLVTEPAAAAVADAPRLICEGPTGARGQLAIVGGGPLQVRHWVWTHDDDAPPQTIAHGSVRVVAEGARNRWDAHLSFEFHAIDLEQFGLMSASMTAATALHDFGARYREAHWVIWRRWMTRGKYTLQDYVNAPLSPMRAWQLFVRAPEYAFFAHLPGAAGMHLLGALDKLLEEPENTRHDPLRDAAGRLVILRHPV